MTDGERLSEAAKRLDMIMDQLVKLKNLSMAQWLDSVTDVEPTSAATRAPNSPNRDVVGHT